MKFCVTYGYSDEFCKSEIVECNSIADAVEYGKEQAEMAFDADKNKLTLNDLAMNLYERPLSQLRCAQYENVVETYERYKETEFFSYVDKFDPHNGHHIVTLEEQGEAIIID